ncbi:hypothetical protein PoB_006681600 [Plakobranchus ocellatus]|uniref:Secreted protein n=1 Tax=Plakobranchus ocellatus TaxID=259542 RepID=A0AAV4D8D7_9GAST|nr:hypothetical protein PoB_006681600 [Plakobranchus ocellatus]
MKMLMSIVVIDVAILVVVVMIVVLTTRFGGVGGTVNSESALRSAGTLLLQVRAPLPAPRPDEGPESLRPPCGLAIYYQTYNRLWWWYCRVDAAIFVKQCSLF